MVTKAWAPVLVAAGALVATVARWFVQGSHNVYTAPVKRFYVPDPDLGWRVSTQHPIWLGLDACALISVVLLGTVAVAFVVRRRKASRMIGLRVLQWIAALFCTSVPVAAFASGPGPLHGQDTLLAPAAVLVETGIEGTLDAPAGTYAVVAHPGTSITARVSAGGEAFDARFATGIAGTWQGDPRALGRAMQLAVRVPAATIDTGISGRTKHARERYLRTDRFPQIAVTLDRLTASRPSGPHELAFRAPALVGLMDQTNSVDVTGTVQVPDAAARARLGLDGDGDVLLVQADLTLAIAATALAPDAKDFDGDRIPIHVSLVLRRLP